jgi:DNA-binding transcriptional regulator YdaS (Cro superfamily)
MDLKTYLKALPEEDSRDAFASRVGTTAGHLNNVAYGYKTCAPALAVAVERESGMQVRRWDLRPKDWHLIWPELIGAEGAPVVLEKAA